MPNFPADPYSIIDVVAQTPTALAPWVTFALPDGEGDYRFHSFSWARTAGAFSVSLKPILSTVIATGGIDIVDEAAVAIAHNTAPAGSNVWSPNDCLRTFRTVSGNIFVAPIPNAYGDTFDFRLRLLRVR